MRRRIDLLVSLLVLLATLALRYQDGPFVAGVRNTLFDSYQRLAPRPFLDQPVRILAIDEESLKHLGQWPWPRDTLARIVDRLTADGAAAIAFDVLLAEPDRTGPRALLKQWQGRADMASLGAIVAKLPDPDSELAAALAKAPAVLAFSFNEEPNGQAPPVKAGFATAGDNPLPFLTSWPGTTRALPDLEKAAPGYGSVNFRPDPDGIIRRAPLLYAFGGQIYPSLAAEALRVAQGASTYIVKASNASGESAMGAQSGLNNVKIGAAIVPVDSRGNVLLYDTGFHARRFIPAWKLLEPDADPNLVAGKIILIGSTAAGLRDFKPTPLNSAAAGIEVHAQILEQILGQQYLQRPDWADGAEMLFLLIFGVALVLLLHPLGALWSAVVTLAAIAASFLFSWLAFRRHGLLVDPLYPGMAAFAVYLCGSLLGYLRSETERRQVRRSFGMYLAPAVVEELSRHPERLKLGGELRDVTVMFSDIRDFTRISEKLDPQTLTHILNAVLTPLTAAIQAAKGTIDKYIGDCIMAFWNAHSTTPSMRATRSSRR
jgi:adenylate cyclase